MSGAPRFALPGTWGRIDLASEATTQRSIRRLVERTTGRDDALSTLRAELRARFNTAATLARENGAVDFHIAMELAPGVPLPAWLAVFLPAIAEERLEELGLTDLRAALDFGVAATAPSNAGVTTIAKNRVQAVRQAFHRVTPETDEQPATELLQVDYWLAAGNPNRIALLTFTTQLVEHEAQMLELFDAIIGTVRWPAPVAP